MRYRLMIAEVQRLIEKQYLESRSGEAKDEYQRSSDFRKRLILTAYVEERTGGAKPWARMLQNILLS